MKIIISKNLAEASTKAAQQIAEIIEAKPAARLGLATGGTPELIYADLVKRHKAGKLDFSQIKTINLDEYLGLDPSHEQSYAYYMNEHLFRHVNIKPESTEVPSGLNDHFAEAARLDAILADDPQEVQLLGVGSTGHVAFNEPDSVLRSNYHIVDLVEKTLQDNARYFDSIDEVPKQAISMGMGGILKANKLILVACGETKIDAMRALLTDDGISTQWPCSFLKLHNDVTIYIDEVIAQAVI